MPPQLTAMQVPHVPLRVAVAALSAPDTHDQSVRAPLTGAQAAHRHTAPPSGPSTTLSTPSSSPPSASSSSAASSSASIGTGPLHHPQPATPQQQGQGGAFRMAGLSPIRSRPAIASVHDFLQPSQAHAVAGPGGHAAAAPDSTQVRPRPFGRLSTFKRPHAGTEERRVRHHLHTLTQGMPGASHRLSSVTSSGNLQRAAHPAAQEQPHQHHLHHHMPPPAAAPAPPLGAIAAAAAAPPPLPSGVAAAPHAQPSTTGGHGSRPASASLPGAASPSPPPTAAPSNLVMDFPPALSADGQPMAPHKPEDLFVLRVPGDERYSWVYCLQLLYP